MEEMTNIMFDKYNDKYHVLDPLGVQWRDGSPSIWSRGTRRRGTSAQPLSDDDHDDDHIHDDDDGVHHDHGFLNTKLHIDHRAAYQQWTYRAASDVSVFEEGGGHLDKEELCVPRLVFRLPKPR